jgi:hypothetical protein
MSGGGGVDGEVYCRRRDRARVTFPDFFFPLAAKPRFQEREGGKLLCKASDRTSVRFVRKDLEKCGTEVRVMHFMLQ